MKIDETLETYMQLGNDKQMSHIFQTPIFFEVLKRSNQRPFTLAAVKEGKVLGGLLGYFGKTSRIASFMFSRLIVFEGPVVVAKAGGDVFEFLLENLKEKARKLNSMIIEIVIPKGDAKFTLDKTGCKQYYSGGEHSAVIDLSKDQQTLWMNLRRDCRKNIRIALRKGVEVKELNKTEDLELFYQIYLETARRRKFHPYRFSFFEAIWNVLKPEKMADFFIASVKGVPIAGRLNLTWASKTRTFISCSLDSFWKFHPNHLLAWQTMLSAKKQNRSRYFVFEHLPKSKNGQRAIDYFTFKTGFGGQLIKERTYCRMVISSNRYKLFQVLDGIYGLVLRSLESMKIQRLNFLEK
jgi:peptidoglycan pentaglycine glycine transferase (the first glycine)